MTVRLIIEHLFKVLLLVTVPTDDLEKHVPLLPIEETTSQRVSPKVPLVQVITVSDENLASIKKQLGLPESLLKSTTTEGHAEKSDELEKAKGKRYKALLDLKKDPKSKLKKECYDLYCARVTSIIKSIKEDAAITKDVEMIDVHLAQLDSKQFSRVEAVIREVMGFHKFIGFVWIPVDVFRKVRVFSSPVLNTLLAHIEEKAPLYTVKKGDDEELDDSVNHLLHRTQHFIVFSSNHRITDAEDTLDLYRYHCTECKNPHARALGTYLYNYVIDHMKIPGATDVKPEPSTEVKRSMEQDDGHSTEVKRSMEQDDGPSKRQK